MPSGNGMAALEPMQEMLARHPLGFAQWLTALDYMLSNPREIVIVDNLDMADPQVLLDVCFYGYHPHQILALGGVEAESSVPLLQNRDQVDGRATVYVCVDLSLSDIKPETFYESLHTRLSGPTDVSTVRNSI